MPIDKELLELIKERLSDLENLLMTFPEKGKDDEYHELVEEGVFLRETLKELKNE